VAADSGNDIRLLLIDSDADLRRLLERRLTEQGYEVRASGDAREALGWATSERFHLTVIDVFAPEKESLEFLKELRAGDPEVQVVVITARDAAEVGVEACRLGAFAALQRPCPFEHLLVVLERAAERAALRRENAALRHVLRRRPPADELPCETPAARQLNDLIERCARTDTAVLIEGEPGTDRERLARAVWARSARSRAPFIPIRPATIDPEQMRAELFGHVQGAFDGATVECRGILELAHGGTVFVDDVADLEPGSQTDLVRLIEHGEIRPIGATSLRPIRLRLLAGTVRDLEKRVETGAFRRDLFTRLSVLRIVAPPLRERADDVLHLAKDVAESIGVEITDEALTALAGYHWPGNERELRAVLERAALLSAEGTIEAGTVRALLAAGCTPEDASLHTLERRHIVEVLHAARGNKSDAAKRLGIDRRKLYRLIEKLGLDDEAG